MQVDSLLLSSDAETQERGTASTGKEETVSLLSPSPSTEVSGPFLHFPTLSHTSTPPLLSACSVPS